jgi:hypothetical protein
VLVPWTIVDVELGLPDIEIRAGPDTCHWWSDSAIYLDGAGYVTRRSRIRGM